MGVTPVSRSRWICRAKKLYHVHIFLLPPTCFGPVAMNDNFFKESRTETEEGAVEKQFFTERDLSQFDAGAAIKKIRGTWPGDESIDHNLDALD